MREVQESHLICLVMKPNKDRIYTNIIGVGFGVITFLILWLFQDLGETSNYINVISIIVNVILAAVIVIYLQNKQNNNRAVKDFFIDYVKELDDEYNDFVKDLYDNNMTNKTIVFWFRVTSEKLHSLDLILGREFNLKHESLQNLNRKIQVLITNNDAFNDNFNGGNYQLPAKIKGDLVVKHKYLKTAFINVCISINRCS